MPIAVAPLPVSSRPPVWSGGGALVNANVVPLRVAPSAAKAWVERLARDHYDQLLAFATRLAGGTSEARDLVQDTFERALRRHDSFVPGTNERAWLFSILHNAFIDHCRRLSARKTVGGEQLEEIPEEAPAEPPQWLSISAEELRIAIGRLEPEFREAYRLHELEACSYKEIAERLAIPINTVGTRIARARQKLRALLASYSSGKEGPRR